MINRFALSSQFVLSGVAFAGFLQPASAYDARARVDLEPLIVKHAAANNVPAPLVHRVIIRESRYNPRAVGRGGALGLMQIKHGTARALGYTGSPAGLLDAETNLTYGVRYLAGAYRVAGGDQNQAVGFYARGYYYDAKRRGMLGVLARGRTGAAEPALVAVAAPQPAPAPSILSLFSPPRPAEPAQPVVEEMEAPVPARRSRSARRQAAAAASTSSAATGSAQTALEAVQPGEAQAESPAGRRTRPVQRTTAIAAPAQAAASETGGRPATLQGAANRSVKESSPVQEPGAEAPAKRNDRSPRRTAATPGAEPTATQAQAAASGTGAQPATLQGAAKRSVKESSGLAVQEPGAEAPVRRSDRSPRRTATSGADRSAQKVSAQPADPGKSP